ncbi:SlyX family protein [Ahrensia sp. 13_GOM-1096m]|uniref:SlyX family protein n=1 Tax=Ahrensia sp. 13_GOM-1096m TaxID=1380380 RepID=UPI000686A97E|nr:SlyX family protein [Ahrensia sp. 13_GOM-1096m]
MMDRAETTRLDDLEILAAHQAQMLDDLNGVVVEQGKIIADLRRRVEALTGRIVEFESDASASAPTQKPPHW